MTLSRPRFPEPSAELPDNVKFLLGLSPSAMTLGLGNITAMLDRLSHPERHYRTVVVAGTNGKGSVVAMTASLLRAQGLRVGRFTSPHVYSVTERIWVDGEAASLAEMEEAASRVAPLRSEIEFSYFEALTAMAFLIFAARNVDVAVLETGLGGRFDSTNVTQPSVSVITSISVDHRRILGDTEVEILREKLGITRPGTPLMIGELGPELLAAVRERAERDSFLLIEGTELGDANCLEESLDGTTAHITTPQADYGTIAIPFPGRHQLTNTLLAIGAAERVMGVPLRHVGAGIAASYLPGRFEACQLEGKSFIVDVAHNEAAILRSAEHLIRVSPREDNAIVLGLMSRKELIRAPAQLALAASRIYLAAPGGDQTGDEYSSDALLQQYFWPRVFEKSLDVVLWRAPLSMSSDRLIDVLVNPENPSRVILALGSHHVIEHVGRELGRRCATKAVAGGVGGCP